ncbi:coronin-1A-like isoform X2 [Portunus trituberculatus]|uniref:coronin-1A-like isoform X2 n=1 Tax=Portunus trituberculatus TaxID=210409 RepID=UPI001E1CCA84|nr:coronin-1A-like isoform X2 [Portunus trituberculatus]
MHIPKMPAQSTLKQNTFRGIRSSKFRHVYGKGARKENCYENVLITQKAHDTAACAVNPKFVAIAVEVAGGGAFIVLPLDKTGRIDINTPKVTGHAGPVLDLKWCPFNDNLIASGADDCTIKLWHIPDGGLKANLTEPLADLQGHQRRVSMVEWHPTAENVLFSAGYDYQILVWDARRGVLMQTLDLHADVIYSLSLNRDGSRLATTSRDKRLRIIDPLSGKVLQEGLCHEGSKACKAVYCGDTGLVFTTGFSRFSDRQYGVWDEKNLNTPLRLDTIDSSSGVLTPFYDHDTRVVFVAGKGDGNIRYYEITDSPPYCHFLSQYISGEPQRGFGVMPKRGCKVSQCEIFRFYKLYATKAICEPISMIVPRKSDQFQPDLYPDTASPTPAMSAEEWFAGTTRGPVLMSMKTGMTIKTHRPLPLRPTESSSDKNADKKYAFLSRETRADYRPLEASVKTSSSTDKDLKTSTNLDTKFQALQKLWGCNVKNMGDNKEQCSTNSSGIESEKTYTSTKNTINKMNIKSGDSPNKLTNYAMQEKEIEILEKPSPKTESELRRAYTAQCEELKLLRRQLIIKDRRIHELEDQLNQFKTHHK